MYVHCTTQANGMSVDAEDRKPKISIVIDEERYDSNFRALLIRTVNRLRLISSLCCNKH